jgi:hypothetical protein
VSYNIAKPHLTFFCELGVEALEELFSDPSVLQDLVELEAAVSLGILDLHPFRAQIARRLKKAGIPVVAWLLLPVEKGYWFNLDNASHAIARYASFKRWTAEYKLVWSGIGLDIEPDIHDFHRLLNMDWRVLAKMLRRGLDHTRFRRAQAAYTALVTQIRADGYSVDSYQLPPIVDERMVGSTFLQRLAGLVDLPTDREVLMLYSNFLRPHGAAILWSYARQADSVGVGSTGGGVQVGGLDRVSPLRWDELMRDLRFASRWKADVHIFSLEGCVRHGYLKRLKTFDWQASIQPPVLAAGRIAKFRRILRTVLWAETHPLLVLAGAFFFARVLRALRPVRKRT